MAWALTFEERRRASWERRGLVEHGGAFLVATCRACGATYEAYTLDPFAAVEELLNAWWGFEDRYTRRNLPWLWSCPDH